MHTRPGDCRADVGFIGRASVTSSKPMESSTQLDKLLWSGKETGGPVADSIHADKLSFVPLFYMLVHLAFLLMPRFPDPVPSDALSVTVKGGKNGRVAIGLKSLTDQ